MNCTFAMSKYDIQLYRSKIVSKSVEHMCIHVHVHAHAHTHAVPVTEYTQKMLITSVTILLKCLSCHIIYMVIALQ